MKLSRKLYKVVIGMKEEKGVDFISFDSKTVVAGDAEEAIRKGRSKRKGTYISNVQLLYEIDKL